MSGGLSRGVACVRLLLVEDNDDLADLLTSALANGGYAVERADNAEDARLMLGVCRYAAVILDLGLPDEDGLAVLAMMRRGGDATPVLILTARSSIDDRVVGLRTGADDYLLKPFAFEELCARLEALLRRPGEMLDQRLRFGRLRFDLHSRQLFLDDAAFTLSARELDMMEILMRNAGQVVMKPHMESHLYGLGEEIASNALDVQVYRLRKRLEARKAGVLIHTVRGVGYMLAQAA